MAKRCAFCVHKDRQKLERALLRREKTQKEIASIIGVARSRVSEHLSKHVKRNVREAMKKDKSIKSGLDVMKQLIEINKVARVIIKEALEAGDGRLTLRAIERVEKQLGLQAALLGDSMEDESTLEPLRVVIVKKFSRKNMYNLCCDECKKKMLEFEKKQGDKEED